MSPSSSSASVRRPESSTTALPLPRDPNKTEFSLDKVVEYLLASKRSLSSTELVWQANELVTTARTQLEEGVQLAARTSFVRQAVQGQVHVLRRVKQGVDHVGHQANEEFEVRKSLLRHQKYLPGLSLTVEGRLRCAI